MKVMDANSYELDQCTELSEYRTMQLVLMGRLLIWVWITATSWLIPSPSFSQGHQHSKPVGWLYGCKRVGKCLALGLKFENGF